MAAKTKTPSSRRTHLRRVLALRVGGRTFRTVFTPDRKAGGYWVRVPELPGCLTEGDTLVEAKRMARDAIVLWLGVATPLGQSRWPASQNRDRHSSARNESKKRRRSSSAGDPPRAATERRYGRFPAVTTLKNTGTPSSKTVRLRT